MFFIGVHRYSLRMNSSVPSLIWLEKIKYRLFLSLKNYLKSDIFFVGYIKQFAILVEGYFE